MLNLRIERDRIPRVIIKNVKIIKEKRGTNGKVRYAPSHVFGNIVRKPKV